MGVFILVLTINYYKHIAQKYEQKLQQKILKNETIYKTIAYNFPNGMILILDHELKIEFLSGKNLKYQSHTINLAATSLSELFKFNNYDTIDRIFKSTLTLGEQHFELNIDEHMFWFALTPFKSPDNNQDKILTIIMNISQRTEMEKKLEDTKVLLDEARKIVQFGNWTWNIITDEFSVSENILEIFNLKQGELARIEDYYNLFISDENKIISTMLSIEVNNEYEKSWESKAVRQNEMYYFSTTAKMSRNASQELIISASITDITEKKRIERNLRKVEDRWKYAIENSNQNIWDYNVFTGMIQIFNPEFMENNDNKEFKIIKFSEWLSFIHPDDGKIINDAMKQYLADDSPEFEKEYRIKDVDGNYMWMLGKGKVVEWDELGKPFRVVGTQMDITDKKIAQIELTNYKDHLEQLVALRTRELQQTNEELEEFTYSITHDLRAPLKAIAGFNDILKEEYYQKNEESNKVWSIIDRNLKYTDQLISDLLSFSKVRNHDLNIQKVDTGQLIKEIIEALSYDHDLEKYSFRVDPLPPIRVDYTLFKQVFMNLISNAIKFSRSKTSPTITIGHFQKQSKTIIFVKDNGVGFNMNYIDRLFKMFKRLHGDDEFEGTGIGLSIVKRIVEIHDGEVWAESTVNNGATFFISL